MSATKPMAASTPLPARTIHSGAGKPPPRSARAVSAGRAALANPATVRTAAAVANAAYHAGWVMGASPPPCSALVGPRNEARTQFVGTEDDVEAEGSIVLGEEALRAG